jgi:hypothetical protein
LMQQLVFTDENGAVQRKAGVMAVVEIGGTVRAGDHIVADSVALEHRPLQPV